MSLSDLPHEIVSAILHTALDGTAVPSDILSVCKLFRNLGTHHLYTHLKFSSVHQLRQFVLSEAPQPPIAPRTLAVDLTGKAQRGVLRDLCNVLDKCQQLASVAAAEDAPHDLRLKHLRLRMHSYTSDSAVDVLERGLQAVSQAEPVVVRCAQVLTTFCTRCVPSPDTFEWTGPDPDHHFSTAIVPPVAACLFKHIPSWRNIREIIVTNISFATSSDPEGRYPPLLENVPSLRLLYIGQATFLHPHAVAGMFCHASLTQLELVRLVDAYSESIWGSRLRRSDIEKAVKVICHTEEQTAVIACIKRVVTCEKKTERIMGGDRVDGTHILE